MSLQRDCEKVEMPIEKRAYVKPELKEVGTAAELTRGQGWSGDSDQWWFFTWGQDPNTS